MSTTEIQLAFAPGSMPPDTESPSGTGVVVAKNPRKEAIVGGPWWGRGFNQAGAMLSRNIDDVVRQFGIRVYELMLYDSAVACAFELLKAGILSDGLVITPAVQRSPGEIVSKRKRKAELKIATEIAEAQQRCIDGLEDPIDETLDDMLHAIPFGCSLAEMTWDWGVGPDKDRLMLKSLVPKPLWSWNPRVDPFMGVMSIRGWTGYGWVDLDTSDYALLTWRKRNRDPRGQSGFRAAYTPWNAKVQAVPDFAEFLKHFADPLLAITAGENSQADTYTDPVTGKRYSRSVIDQIVNALETFKRRKGLALPYGATVNEIGGKSDGAAYHAGFDRYDLEIFRAILFSARPVQEAKHGSKADSETGLDLVGMAFERGRVPLARCIRNDVFREFVRLNWGKEAAKLYVPNASFGMQGHVASDLLNAYASAYQKGFVDEAQLPAIWEKLGLPALDEDQLQARVVQITEARKARLQGDPNQDPEQQDGEDPSDGSKPAKGKGSKPGKGGKKTTTKKNGKAA